MAKQIKSVEFSDGNYTGTDNWTANLTKIVFEDEEIFNTKIKINVKDYIVSSEEKDGRVWHSLNADKIMELYEIEMRRLN